MVRIPYIKIPSVRVGSIVPTSNIGTGGATPAPPSPTPITYLTQWKMMGNSTVHTDEYLTQWKVEGNSVVDNNTILSCGDLGQDGKYHVKISNGVTIYDIALDEPLRKVNNVADTIEYADGVATLTRNFASVDLGSFSWTQRTTNTSGIYRYSTNVKVEVLPNCIVPSTKIAIALCPKYSIVNPDYTYGKSEGIGLSNASDLANGQIIIYDSNANTLSASDFQNYLQGVELIYQITPTTETIQVSPFPISPTDTYTSANDTPYSAFEYKKNVEIWSCGEYNVIDGKYHILVQPQGGSIADIALDEPLRKVNDVADSIEFVNGVATLTRNLASVDLGDCLWTSAKIAGSSDIYRMITYSVHDTLKTVPSEDTVANILTSIYNSIPVGKVNAQNTGIGVNTAGYIIVYDENYNQSDSANTFKTAMNGVELIYELATPTTETIQVPQIEEADSYTCEISQGGKAVSWSSFETDRE